MTTAVKIMNVSNIDEKQEHLVDIKEGENVIHTLAEGDTYSTHLFTGRQLTVEERLVDRPAKPDQE